MWRAEPRRRQLACRDDARASARRAVEQSGGIVPSVIRKLNLDPVAVARDARKMLAAMPRCRRDVQASPRIRLVIEAASGGPRLQDEYVRRSICSSPSPPRRALPAAQLSAERRDKGRALQRLDASARQPARPPPPRVHIRGADALRARPDRAGAQEQAGPGDRPRRGSASRDPGSVPADQEQPCLIGEPASARPRSSRAGPRIVRGDVRKGSRKADLRARYRCADCRAKYRGEFEERLKPCSRRSRTRRARSSSSSTSSHPWSAPARARARWTRPRC